MVNGINMYKKIISYIDDKKEQKLIRQVYNEFNKLIELKEKISIEENKLKNNQEKYDYEIIFLNQKNIIEENYNNLIKLSDNFKKLNNEVYFNIRGTKQNIFITNELFKKINNEKYFYVSESKQNIETYFDKEYSVLWKYKSFMTYKNITKLVNYKIKNIIKKNIINNYVDVSVDFILKNKYEIKNRFYFILSIKDLINNYETTPQIMEYKKLYLINEFFHLSKKEIISFLKKMKQTKYDIILKG